ncbi:NAD(P)-dependent alcohol dehydrogenase [Rhodobacteraceae bacterium CCMM004]|nr:NAD(P)-dependent alcohol dehydrogenase [Rhodobacteraceae bacterium CCMM004]
MRAAVYDRYGAAEVVRVADVPEPRPRPGEILVEVAASAVTTADWRFRASAFPGGLWLIGRALAGLRRPRHRVLGSNFAGRVAALGDGVARFAVGDRVFGASGLGAHAERVAVRADAAVARIPDGVSDTAAAATPFGALAARSFVREIAEVGPGTRLLIAGASGEVGSWAVQIARAAGAHVTALARAETADRLRGLGADAVIDYRRQDVTRGAARYDVVLDTAGVLRYRDVRRILAAGGRFVPLEFSVGMMLRGLWDRGLVLKVSTERAADLEAIAEGLAAGTLTAPVDGVWPLAHIAEAHARVESRHREGAAVVALRPAAAISAAA